MWRKFGSSWFGVIFNPVGYMAQRKSAPKAAQEYADRYPPAQALGTANTEIQLRENAGIWVSGCANQLKTDDVGKTLANSTDACNTVFYADPVVMAAFDGLAVAAAEDEEEQRRQAAEGLKRLTIGAAMVVFVLILVYLFTSK